MNEVDSPNIMGTHSIGTRGQFEMGTRGALGYGIYSKGLNFGSKLTA